MKAPLFQLDDNLIAHALSFLGDLDDLISVAATCAGACAFLETHWARLKPDVAFYHAQFVHKLCNTHIIQSMAQRAVRDVTTGVGVGIGFLAEAPSVVRRFRVEAMQRQPIPISAGCAAQSIRVALGPSAPKVILLFSIGDTDVLWIRRGQAQLFTDAADSLELMQFLQHFPHAGRHAVTLLCSHAVDVEITERACACDGVGDARHWVYHRVGCSEECFTGETTAATALLRLSVPTYAAEGPIEYLTFYTIDAAAPRVKTFTLKNNGREAVISGQHCLVRNGRHAFYRIPVQRAIDYSTIDSGMLEVEFAAAPPVATKFHAGALVSGVFTHVGGYFFTW